MMSDVCYDDLIKRLLSFNCDGVIEEVLPLLLSFVERNENAHLFPQVMDICFGTLLKQLSCNIIEEKVLSPVLSFLQKTFRSNILKIEALVKIQNENKRDEVSIQLHQLLQVCDYVLDGYSLLIDYVMKQGSIKLQYVKSLMDTLPSVLLTGFNHCHESENFYGIYFSSSTEQLTAVFRKSYDLSNMFYKCIDECIKFDFKIEGVIDIFIRALQTLYSVGEIVVHLDVKTLMEQWKGLIKISSKYSYFLKDKIDISLPLKFLASKLEDIITTVMEKQILSEIDEKFRIRNLKLASFVLKVIVKLCETYKGYLSGCEAHLLNLLLLLNRCSRLVGKNDSIEIERFIVVGAAPLLSHLLEDRSFLEKFGCVSNDLESLSSEEAIGFLFTHLRLFKFLISCVNEEVRENWLKIPLVSNVLTLFSMSYSVLDFNIKIEEKDAYTTLISTTAAYIASCFSPEIFVETESMLLQLLFEGNIETSILVSDLLSLLGRLTNSEVCLKETKFLCKILCDLSGVGIQRPEISIVALTAGRLFHLLSKDGQDTIEKSFQPQLHPYLWLYLNNELLSSHEISIFSLLKGTNDISSHSYLHMIELLTLHNVNNNVEITNKLYIAVEQLWTGFEAYHRLDDRQPDWWYYIFFLLTKCISNRIVGMDNLIIEKILNDLLKFTAMKQSSINYYVCIILKKITHIFSENDGVISNIFINCISSNNFLIKQIAIESFVHFADTFRQNAIITNVISDPNIEYYMSDYLKKIPLCTVNNITEFPIIFSHKCFVYDRDIHPSKKLKLNNENQEMQRLLSNLLGCINSIKEFMCKRDLSVEEREVIMLAISNLEKL